MVLDVFSILFMKLKMSLFNLNYIYIIYIFGVAPIIFLLLSHHEKSFTFLKISVLSAGFVAAVSNTIRIFSAAPIILFYSVYCIGNPEYKISQKLLLTFLFLGGYSIPYFHYQSYPNRVKVFLQELQPEGSINTQKYGFLHNIYTGLGFLNNDQDISLLDQCAFDRVLKINPKAKTASFLYEKTIKNEIFRLCKEKRYFIATTIFAKLGVILYYFLIYFGLLGILTSWLYPKPWYLECAFWGALGISALPGVLILPSTDYLIWFISITILYSFYSLLWAFSRGLKKESINWLIKKYKRTFYASM